MFGRDKNKDKPATKVIKGKDVVPGKVYKSRPATTPRDPSKPVVKGRKPGTPRP